MGSYSGPYKIHIIHSELGEFDTSDLPTLDVNGYIYDFSPIIGSPYGGATIEITGEPYSTNPEYGT